MEPPVTYILRQKFKELREKILAMERVLLQIIAFDMFIEHPYKYIMKYRALIPGASLIHLLRSCCAFSTEFNEAVRQVHLIAHGSSCKWHGTS